jgi:hypothetical protein
MMVPRGGTRRAIQPELGGREEGGTQEVYKAREGVRYWRVGEEEVKVVKKARRLFLKEREGRKTDNSRSMT